MAKDIPDTKKPINPYEVTEGMSDISGAARPSSKDVDFAILFLENLHYHAEEHGVQAFLDYAKQQIEEGKLPMPREREVYLDYSESNNNHITEMEIFKQTAIEFENNKKEDRREFLMRLGFLGAAGIVSGTAVANMEDMVRYLNSDKVSEKTRDIIDTTMKVCGVATGLTLLGLVGVGLSKAHSNTKDTKEDKYEIKDPDQKNFASKISEVRKLDCNVPSK